MSDLESFKAMLGFTWDMFFEYIPAAGTIEIFNTIRSRLKSGLYSYDSFKEELKRLVKEEDHPAIDTLESHINSGEEEFAVKLAESLFENETDLDGTLIQGRRITMPDGTQRIIGRVHPLHPRGKKNHITYDALTGLMSKMDIAAYAKNLIDTEHAKNTAIAILDVDFFKQVNDTYGHSFGDEVLQKVAQIMKESIGEKDLAGRIGGDEFFIVFRDVDHGRRREILHRIKMEVNKAFPGRGPEGEDQISMSMGTARYPEDADSYEDLFSVADYCLYLAKQKGRNRFIIYTHDRHASLETIKNARDNGVSLFDARGEIPPGEVMARMEYMTRYGKKPRLFALLDEFAGRLSIPMVMIYDKEGRLLLKGGHQAAEAEKADRVSEHFLRTGYEDTFMYKNGMVICNNVSHLPAPVADSQDALLEADLKSFVRVGFRDMNGADAYLVFVSLHELLVWNSQHYMYYRLFADLLAGYDLQEEYKY